MYIYNIYIPKYAHTHTVCVFPRQQGGAVEVGQPPGYDANDSSGSVLASDSAQSHGTEVLGKAIFAWCIKVNPGLSSFI